MKAHGLHCLLIRMMLFDILSLPAIADAMKQTDITSAEMLLGVGLPIDIYGTQEEAFRKYFLRGSINFEFEGSPYSCRIVEAEVMLEM